MVAWTTETEPSTLSETFYWTEEQPLTAQDRSAWKGQAAEVRAPAGFYWTLELDPPGSREGDDVWRGWINPTAGKKQTFLGVSEAVENLNVDPEDMELEPEFIQDDRDEWVIEVEPD